MKAVLGDLGYDTTRNLDDFQQENYFFHCFLARGARIINYGIRKSVVPES